jgi:hypothetical protein
VATPVELEDPHRAAQPHPAGAHVLVKAVLEAILRLRVMLRPEIAERVRAAQLQGHAVIDLPLGNRVWAVEPIAAVDLGALATGDMAMSA